MFAPPSPPCGGRTCSTAVVGVFSLRYCSLFVVLSFASLCSTCALARIWCSAAPTRPLHPACSHTAAQVHSACRPQYHLLSKVPTHFPSAHPLLLTACSPACTISLPHSPPLLSYGGFCLKSFGHYCVCFPATAHRHCRQHFSTLRGSCACAVHVGAPATILKSCHTSKLPFVASEAWYWSCEQNIFQVACDWLIKSPVL